jgi:hypothetical protein
MAAPSYTTDLNDFCLMETGDSFFEFSGYTLGDNAALETDWYLQGSSCASDEANGKTGVGHSIGFDYGSTPTFNTGDCFFAWMMCMAGNAMDTYANGGYRVLMGDASGTFYGWRVGGRDVGRNPYGGWVNVVVDPTHTADYTSGTPTNWRYSGVAFNMTSAISKGRPINADAYRWGRGELIIEYGETANYGVFSGIAAQNDSSANQWGLFSDQFGSYLWKGLLSFGNATNACDFRDANANIIVDETPKTYAAFNKIEINNASSRVDWTGVNITALQDGNLGADSGLSPGTFEMVDNATVNFINCVFTDMNTFVFQSNATLDTVTFRRCALVTQGGSTIGDCVFDEAAGAVALLVNNLDLITNCDFTSDGTGYAIELTAAHAGGSFDHVNITYTSYGADGTANACIYNNSGGAVTINVSGGDTPTYTNGSGASTTIVAGAVTVKVTVTNAAGTLIDGARVFLKAANATGPFPYQESVTISNSGTTATVSHTAHGLLTNDKVLIEGAGYDANLGVHTITKISDNSYSYTMSSSPGDGAVSGTITSTFVALSGLTSSGIVSTSRVYSASQPVIGWARKSSGTPYYKTGPLSGSVSNTEGYNNTAVLILDE